MVADLNLQIKRHAFQALTAIWFKSLQLWMDTADRYQEPSDHLISFFNMISNNISQGYHIDDISGVCFVLIKCQVSDINRIISNQLINILSYAISLVNYADRHFFTMRVFSPISL